MIINISKIIKDKEIKGFHWFPVFFFSSWSVFNIYYYPHLNQILSTVGAIIMAISTIVYAYLVIYYTLENRKHNVLIKEYANRIPLLRFTSKSITGRYNEKNNKYK